MSTQSALLTPGPAGQDHTEDQQVAELFCLSGDYDAANTPALWESLHALIQQNSGNIALDLSGVTFMDASGIRVIVMAQQVLELQSHRVTLRNPSTCAARLLDICGLEALID